MIESLSASMSSVGYDIAFFFRGLAGNQLLFGFLLGMMTTVFITGFILTENPRHIPMMLRYSQLNSYRRINEHRARRHRAKHGDHPPYTDLAFEEFVKIYIRVRVLFLLAFLFAAALVILSLLKIPSG